MACMLWCSNTKWVPLRVSNIHDTILVRTQYVLSMYWSVLLLIFCTSTYRYVLSTYRYVLNTLFLYDGSRFQMKSLCITPFGLYPAGHVSGRGPAGLGKPKLLLFLTCIYMVYTWYIHFMYLPCMYMVYTWFRRVHTCLYRYKLVYTRFNFYKHVYTMYIHVCTNYVWCHGTEGYIHFLKCTDIVEHGTYTVQTSLNRVRTLLYLFDSAFFLPCWLACGQCPAAARCHAYSSSSTLVY